MRGKPSRSIVASAGAPGRVTGTSTGSTNVTPGIRLHAGPDLSFHGFVQLPAYQRVNESQLAPRTSVLLGLTRTF